MLTLRNALLSTIGRKFLTAITAAALVLFTITHLAANLNLLRSDPTPFNAYAATLAGYGKLLYMAELGLLVMVIIHVILAVWLRFGAQRARPVGYEMSRTKLPSRKSTFSSRTLIVSGTILLVFLIIHIKHFKFGPGVAEGYSTDVHGETVRDLHRLVVESFRQPLYSAFYVFALIFFGFHLQHGIWSIFQSLGITNPRTTRPLYVAGVALSAILAGGFMLIPIWIYFSQ